MNWLDLLTRHDYGSEKNEPMYARIANRLRDAIESGQLPENAQLPTNRELAAQLRVDRSTVSRAYLELAQAGLIDSHVGRGTFVKPASQRRPNVHALSENSVSWGEKFSKSSQSTFDLLSRQPIASSHQAEMISFAGGVPTAEFYPQDQFQRIVSQLLKSSDAGEMFGYSPAEGHPMLREEVQAHLKSHGIAATDSELLIVSGSQQGIDLVTNVFVDPGDFVLLEDPSYFWAICNFRSRQARCIPLSLDEEGLRLDQLENFLARQKAKLLYVMPTFQNPTGATMSLARRMKLLELARQHQLPILEDNFVGDLGYDHAAIPPLRSLPGGQELVIHQGTFSKALCPGLRLGWLVAPPEVISRLLLAKRTSDLSTNSIAQVVLAKYLKEGLYKDHLVHVRDAYTNRRDTMLGALRRYFPDPPSQDGRRLSWSQPHGGLFIWAKLPDGLSARELLVYAERAGVTFSPGELFFVNGDRQEYFRLCFIQTDETAILQGIERLSNAARNYFETIAKSGSPALAGRTRARDNVLI